MFINVNMLINFSTVLFYCIYFSAQHFICNIKFYSCLRKAATSFLTLFWTVGGKFTLKREMCFSSLPQKAADVIAQFNLSWLLNNYLVNNELLAENIFRCGCVTLNQKNIKKFKNSRKDFL